MYSQLAQLCHVKNKLVNELYVLGQALEIQREEGERGGEGETEGERERREGRKSKARGVCNANREDEGGKRRRDGLEEGDRKRKDGEKAMDGQGEQKEEGGETENGTGLEYGEPNKKSTSQVKKITFGS